MAQAKGGRKLRRGKKRTTTYASQFHRTARNKANRVSRIARRKRDNPNVRRKEKLALKREARQIRAAELAAKVAAQQQV